MLMTEQQRELAAANMDLAFYLAKKYGKQERYVERDVAGDALIGLCEAAIRYKSGSVPFSSYAAMVIMHRMRRDDQLDGYHKRGGGKAHHVSMDTIVYDDAVPTRLGDLLPDACDVFGDVSGRQLVERIKNMLDDREQQIVTMRMDGYRNAEIARLLDLTRARVGQIVRGIARKVERSGVL